MPSISLIIPTYNGVNRLPTLLKSISCQSVLPDEIIVVIDGSSDSSEEYLKRQRIIHNIKVLIQDNKGRAAVRNFGASCASNELLLFVDDDMELDSRCVEQHLIHHSLFPGSIVSGSQIDPINSKRTDFQLFKNKLSMRWVKDLMHHENISLPSKCLYLTAANMSISRVTFNLLSGFNIRLRDAEDYDLALRADRIGISVFYRHSAFGWHNDNVTCSSFIYRLKEYKRSHFILMALSSNQYSNDRRLFNSSPRGLKRLIFKFFAFKFWVKFVDSGILLFLPQNMRYRIYDMIITAKGIYRY